ncbi:hypothetical protein TcCL_NonESM01602 [Trypanosoma cruzi]|nr:hypothetical protein TcCL_NonESM01602 [Trypanosoma cruzi]
MPTPSRKCGIGMLSFNFSCTERINTSQCVHPTLRWRTVLLRNENRRLQGANAIWRQPLPNPRNEGHVSVHWKRGLQLGVPIYPDGEKFPLPGKGRQMHSRTGPRMAHRHHPTTSVWWPGARLHPQFPNPFSREGDGGSILLRHWALWATAFPSPRDFALSISGFRRGFRFK